MNYLQAKFIFLLLAGMLLMSSSTHLVAKEGNANTLHCSASNPSEQCLSYVRGYLDALQLLEQERSTIFSSFEQRAFTTRTGKNKSSHPLEDKLGICMPDKVDATELLASISNNRPINIALLEALRMKYPC